MFFVGHGVYISDETEIILLRSWGSKPSTRGDAQRSRQRKHENRSRVSATTKPLDVNQS